LIDNIAVLKQRIRYFLSKQKECKANALHSLFILPESVATMKDGFLLRCLPVFPEFCQIAVLLPEIIMKGYGITLSFNPSVLHEADSPANFIQTILIFLLE